MSELMAQEIHLRFFVRPNMPKDEYRAVCKTLNDARFHTAVKKAVETAMRRRTTLRRVKVRLTF